MPDSRVYTEVSETKNYSTLKIKYDCGLNGEGKTIVKSRSYSNVKANAKALDVFNVAETLISLQQHDKLSIVKLDNTELN
ncbi:DUF1659 domain-containing protein [Paraclostridium sordellii]|uniref:DUF1659 domain-containing protein n=1 Tax=Paraclostridium sordellii TaxID=1505 RepID=UPI0005E955E3|nr:DUF1659 domain-containing protein [Paeniclostridium sordellii]CEN21094.1 Protein of uncharacterised function (DUF1659) [[Clostridium] sordellii] [Paeniclostridium sordellii]CEP40345.1 Protein of uncharacterised function (DUF1659) [[Clostridium] sordellii] [Paeniclostridium sordellii]CEP43477.1 Protein of uncharacterised function (DUF1659) [[Clostridium] sordellii] [Paeniclostridium sordellii]CEP98518.1 Protein of uncharacterised function (DUF1659) [[Clostridium] sordellii] [Paeniclostridium 